jgi:hypothetical protein
LAVLGFTLLISVFHRTALRPLRQPIQSTRPQLAGTLKDQAGSVVGGAERRDCAKRWWWRRYRFRLLLLIAAGTLSFKSLKNLQGIPSGL